MKKIIKEFKFRGVFAVGFLLVGSLSATELSCNSVEGNANGPTCSMDVYVDKNNGTALGRWNGQNNESKLDVEDDNLAEFYFDGAEAGIWEKEVEDGKTQWAGFILAAESDAWCRVKCVEATPNRLTAND